ncbi:nucleotidyltransferase [Bacteroidia bacterium]|nr:nucleotidyltransferase [Bacteroidia bacterium]
MNNWQNNPTERQRIIIENIALQTGYSPHAIEKDWWVTMVLKSLFQTSCANCLVFKGGTSLGKCWNLIERFSEDIDVAIFRDFFGITEISSKNQRDKLRKASSKYIQECLIDELDEKLKALEISGYTIELEQAESSDKDPRVVFVKYSSLFPENKYLKNWVKIEISCRSLREPYDPVKLRSIIAENYPNERFADESFVVNTVSPKRTFLEKAFLLHEALQKGRIHSLRMTRHLYDLHKLMDTDFAKDALSDMTLYKTIVEHRSIMTREKGVDYSTHRPSQINFIPESEEVIEIWQDDYKNMRETFFYEVPILFDELLKRMEELRSRFRAIQMDETFFDDL